jgi:hypothetical protein
MDYTTLLEVSWLEMGGIIFLVLCLIAIVVIGVSLCFVSYKAVDTWFVKSATGEGVVVGKTHTPGYWRDSEFYDPLGVHTARGHYVPDEYLLVIDVRDNRAQIRVSEEVFAAYDQVDAIKVSYSYGRISKRLLIKNVLYA